MTADQRVTAAREYLGYTRQVNIADLPHSSLTRMAAELRRQLGQVVDVVTELLFTIEDAEDLERDRDATHVDVDGGVWLTPPDALVLAQALADAIAYRDPGPCSACAAEFGGLCYEHAEAEEKADAYATLAARSASRCPVSARQHHGTVARQLEAVDRLDLDKAARISTLEARADLAERRLRFIVAQFEEAQPGSAPGRGRPRVNATCHW